MRERSKRPHEWRKPAGMDDVLEHSDLSVHFLSFWCLCSKYCLYFPSFVSRTLFVSFHWENMFLAFISITKFNNIILLRSKKKYFVCDVYGMFYTRKISEIISKYFSIMYFCICAFVRLIDIYIFFTLHPSFIFFVKNLKLKQWTPNGDTNCASSLLDIEKRPRRDERSWKAMALIGSFLHLQKGICRGQNCRSPVANRRVTLFDRGSTCRDGASLKISERAARKWAEGFQTEAISRLFEKRVTPTQ